MTLQRPSTWDKIQGRIILNSLIKEIDQDEKSLSPKALDISIENLRARKHYLITCISNKRQDVELLPDGEEKFRKIDEHQYLNELLRKVKIKEADLVYLRNML